MKPIHRLAASALVLSGALCAAWLPAASAAAGDVPNGKPFRYLHSRIDALQAQIDDLIGQVSSLKEWQVAAQEALDALRADTDANKAAIALLESEMENVKSILDTKQDILNGNCPDGQYVYGISQGPATLLCRADMGANGLVLETVMVTQVIQGNNNGTLAAECTAGTVVMGGSYEAGPGLDVSNAGIQDNSYSVDAANTTVDGIPLNVTATCLGVAP